MSLLVLLQNHSDILVVHKVSLQFKKPIKTAIDKIC